MNIILKESISSHIKVMEFLLKDEKYLNSVNLAIKALVKSCKNNHHILIFGNGGSASDANHFSAELVCTFKKKNRKAINCISLTSNTSILTAWGNDKDFDDCFARQISAFNGNKVICIGISTSGKSKNIVKGLKEAKKNGFKTIALIGSSSEIIKKYSDIIISIKAKDTDRIQEAHLFTYHFLCQEIEKQI